MNIQNYIYLTAFSKTLTTPSNIISSWLKQSYEYAYDITDGLTNEYVVLPVLTGLQVQVSWTVQHTQDSSSLACA